MVIGIQVVGLTFGFIMLYLTYIYFKKKDFNKADFKLWIIIWVLFLLAILFPSSVNVLLEALDVNSAMTLFAVLAIILLIAIVFYLYRIVRRNQRRIEKVVRLVALKKKHK